MKQRSPIAVFFLSLITFGIYSIVWSVKTKNEMNKLGSEIPTAWLIIIPFVSLYWYWKYSEGVEKVTNGSISTVLSFVLLILLGIIGMAVLQNDFNKINAAPSGASVPPVAGSSPGLQTAYAQPQPDSSFGGPVTPTASVNPVASKVEPSVTTPSVPSATANPPVPDSVTPTQSPEETQDPPKVL